MTPCGDPLTTEGENKADLASGVRQNRRQRRAEKQRVSPRVAFSLRPMSLAGQGGNESDMS